MSCLVDDYIWRHPICRAKPLAIMEKELSAVLVFKETKDAAAAERLIKDATEIELSMDAPSGPADPIKPSFELYGAVLLQLNRPAEAAAQFQRALRVDCAYLLMEVRLGVCHLRAPVVSAIRNAFTISRLQLIRRTRTSRMSEAPPEPTSCVKRQMVLPPSPILRLPKSAYTQTIT